MVTWDGSLRAVFQRNFLVGGRSVSGGHDENV
jgi:hypothetical protein